MKTILISITMTAAALPASSCHSVTPSADGKLQVVASFYPLAEVAQQVGADHVIVTNLTAPGVEPHDLELTPDQLEAISTAEVLLFLGGGFQPAVQDALGDASGDVVDVSSAFRTLPVPPGENHGDLTADPHVWLDPVLYGDIVRRVEQALAAADPADAPAFRANLRTFMKRLARLDQEYRAGLSDCQRDIIVTTHAAFGYLARRYGLRQEAISGFSPEAEPSPQRLAQLQALVEREHITTIFTEELVSPDVADALARETGATTAVLDPLESLTPSESAAGDDYVSLMERNLATLRSALDCP